MAVEFRCTACHRQYRLKDEMAGRKAKCQCGNRMQVPHRVGTISSTSGKSSGPGKAKNGAAVSTAPVKLAPSTDAEDTLALAPTAETVVLPATEPCPDCGAKMKRGTTVCCDCGYDTRYAGQHHGAGVGDAAHEKTLRFKFGMAVSLLFGAFLGSLGALLGTILWAVFAFFTWSDLGFLAWGVGALVGGGMALAHQDDDGRLAGGISAVVAFFSVLTAKVVVAIVLAVGIALAAVEPTDDSRADPLKRQLVARELMRQDFARRGIVEPSREQTDEAMASAQRKVEQMRPQEVQQLLNSWQEQFEPERNTADPAAVRRGKMSEQTGIERRLARAPRDKKTPPPATESQPSTLPPSTNATPQPETPSEELPASQGTSIFHPLDILYMLLACATAYKLGSGKAQK